jgi:hypothetical protein
MPHLYKRWDEPRCRFGDAAVVFFLVAQCLDGVFTYLGIAIYGIGIEANPIVGAAVAALGPFAGLASAKLVAAVFGMVLHLHRIHTAVAVLTIVYVAAAIVPWTLVLLRHF